MEKHITLEASQSVNSIESESTDNIHSIADLTRKETRPFVQLWGLPM